MLKPCTDYFIFSFKFEHIRTLTQKSILGEGSNTSIIFERIKNKVTSNWGK